MGERERMALRWCAPVGLVALVCCAAVPVQRAGEGIVGRAIVQTITPVVDGNLFSDNATHYEDPYQTKCGAEEINITIVGVKGAMCSPVCGALDSCPPIQADSNVTAKARCVAGHGRAQVLRSHLRARRRRDTAWQHGDALPGKGFLQADRTGWHLYLRRIKSLPGP